MSSLSESIRKVFGVGHEGPILGVDIGSSSIKVVLIEKVREKVVLRNYGEIALGPRGDVSVGRATNILPQKVAEALHDILKETGIVPRHTFISIPFSASLITVVDLPDLGKKELDSMIPLEARRYVPVPISEVSLDWWVLPKRRLGARPAMVTAPSVDKKGEKREVIIAAIHNDVISKYELIKRDAQIPADAAHFEIEIFSTLRAIVGSDLAPVLVVDIGAGNTKLALADEGVVHGSHVVSMGSQDITLALSRSRGISFDEAEEKKCRAGVEGEGDARDVLAVAELVVANIMNETIRFVQNYEHKHNTSVAKIILVGGGARLKGIEKIVAQSFPKASVVIGDPFSRLDTPAFLAKTLKELSPSFAVAVGLALKGLEE